MLMTVSKGFHRAGGTQDHRRLSKRSGYKSWLAVERLRCDDDVNRCGLRNFENYLFEDLFEDPLINRLILDFSAKAIMDTHCICWEYPSVVLCCLRGSESISNAQRYV